MASGEKFAGWHVFARAELPPAHDALGFLECSERPYASTNAPLTETRIFNALENSLSTGRLDAEHIPSLEWARQNAPRSDQVSLPRRKSRYLLRQSSTENQSHAIQFASDHGHHNSQSFPIQRWRHSPPEEEAASLSAIYNALHSSSHDTFQANEKACEEDIFRSHPGPSSVTSLDSGASGSSVLSSTSVHSTVSTNSRKFRVTKSRKLTKGGRKSMTSTERKFKCTFCCDTFKHKFDWSRHEKSLHLDLEEWRCTPYGAQVVRPETRRVHCAYCDLLDPTLDHISFHNHEACHNGRTSQRSFRRKDHLVQHLRLVHRLDVMPLMEDWKAETMAVVSRCGFCNVILGTWEERIDHLTIHFRAGKTMLDWQGDHGFEPAVAARVTNSLPPYLIGSESLAPVPFSATNPASIDHFKQISSQIGCFAQDSLVHIDQDPGESSAMNSDYPGVSSEAHQPTTSVQELDTVAFADILTRHLAQFARKHMAAGIVPTDDMFQRESRRVLYGDEDDAWNTTVADNADWLESFRKYGGFERQRDI